MLETIIDPYLSRTLPADIAPTTESKIVRDAVWGMIELRPHEVIIIDTPLFQRLRGIFQTGFTYFVYPCAVHSRFEHSLGCLHLAGRYWDALQKRIKTVRGAANPAPVLCDAWFCTTVRLAALLHDISHCIFSHVSENVYKRDSRVSAAIKKVKDLFPATERADVGAAEAVAYFALTSDRFSRFFDKVRTAVGVDSLPTEVTPENIARLIVGLSLKERPNLPALTQIINGPFDVDKVDYQTRDGYFTGVALPVDVERLLSSLCIVQDDKTGNHELLVDHRGIAPIEQLLFNRMLLYDSVYHHHKIRASVQLFESYVDSPEKLPFEWLLEHDEYDFFGFRNTPPELDDLIYRLRHRNLPYRAAIVHQNTINHPADPVDDEWSDIMQKLFSTRDRDRDEGVKRFKEIRETIRQHLGPSTSGRFYVDVPQPPKYMKI